METEKKNFQEDLLEVKIENQEKPREIIDAVDLDDLCKILTEKKEIIGSKSEDQPNGTTYKTEDFVAAIENIKGYLFDRCVKDIDLPAHQMVDIIFNEMKLAKAFTRTEGLRDTVVKLFKDYAERIVREEAIKMLKFDKNEDKE